MTFSKLTTAALLTALTLSTSGCIIHVGGQDNNDSGKSDYSSVFGGVDVTENKQVGDLSSVNGNITMQDNVSARDVDAVNGNIEAANNVSVHDLSTVNGDIQTQSYLSVKGDVSTVNGNISFGENSKVNGDVATVNGDISLTKTAVGDDIKTKNGSITLHQGSIVEGDIEFESQDDSSWWADKSREHNPPTLTIDGSSDVKGKIILRQVVVLEIENPELLAKVERRYKGQE
jgi:cytoskeletal protein CcmA (bactofilin family)